MNESEAPLRNTAGARRAVALQIGGLLVAATALAARWALGHVTSPVPPGLVILLVAAGLLVLWRPVTVLIAIGAGAFMAFQLLVDADPAVLRGSAGGAVATVLWIELAGVLVAMFAGIAALIAVQRAAHRGTSDPWDWRPLVQVAGLLVLAPICAEYLSAYDESTGQPGQLLTNLIIFIPLYGCPALLIREAARRWGLGWPGIFLLAAAFGLTQAGLVDQSLFSVDYRGIDGWEEGYQATLVPALGISVFNAVNFVGGHVAFSMAAPIALVEAARPATARTPWLTRRALVVVAVGYLGASALVLNVHLTTEASHASPAQLIITAILVLALITLAALGRGWHPAPLTRRAPGLWLTFLITLVIVCLDAFATETWVGTAMAVAAYGLAGLFLFHASRLVGWSVAHIAVVAAVPLLVRAVLAFTYDPLIGEVSEVAKYGHNLVMLAVVLLATALALRPRLRRSTREPVPVA
ncbi:MAG: hypothetical protein ABWY56_15375 [Propionibacteriaceae bacterium]